MATYNDYIYAYYKFDESSTNGTAGELTDSSYSGTKGGKVNAAQDLIGTGKFNNCMDFSKGDGAEVKCGELGEFALSLWVKPHANNDSGRACLVQRQNDWYLETNNKELVFRVYNNTTVSTGTLLDADTWYHLALSYTLENGMKIWVNASLIHSEPIDFVAGISTNTAWIGTWDGGTNDNFDGLMDELVFYSEGIDQTIVNGLYNSGSGKELTPTGIPFDVKESITTVYKVKGGTAVKTYGNQTNGMNLMDSDMAVGDYLTFHKTYYMRSSDAGTSNDYFRGVHKYSGLEFNVSQALAASAYTYVWEYYRHKTSDWVPLPDVIDDTVGFTASGTNSVKWKVPKDWSPTRKLLNSDFYAGNYTVRIRITGLDSITTDAIQDKSTNIKDYSWALWIRNGNSYVPLDLYKALKQEDPTLVEKSIDNKNITISSNIIIEDGSLNIYDGVTLTVGKIGGNDKAHSSIEILNNGTLQLGVLTAEGRGHRGGELKWNNGNDTGNSLRWFGNTKCYGSRVWMYGYGYVGLTNSGAIEIVDSIWVRHSKLDRWYFASESSGSITRSSIQNYYFYVYSPRWVFDGLTLVGGDAGTLNGMVAGGGSHTVKIGNTDANMQVRVTQRSCVALINCTNVSPANFDIRGDHPEDAKLSERYTIDYSILDTSGVGIQDCVFGAFDAQGNSGLVEDLYYQDNTYVTDLDAGTADTSGMFYNVPAGKLNPDDIIEVRSERIKLVTDLSDGGTKTGTVVRDQPGSVCNGRHINHDVYKVNEYVLSNASGKIVYTGTKGDLPYDLTVYSDSRVDDVDYTRDHNPFVIRARKYGYVFNEITASIKTSVISNVYLRDNLFVSATASVASSYSDRVTIDPSAKTITVTDSCTPQELYDYCQYWASNNKNIRYESPLETYDGQSYNVTSDWELILQVNVDGLTASSLKVSGEINLTNVNVSDDLHIDTKTNSSLTFNNVVVSGSVYNDNTSGTLTINAIGSSSMTAGDVGTGNGETNIVQSVQFKFTVTPSITGYEWRIYQVDAKGSLKGAVDLAGEESATADNQTYSYNYTSDIEIALQILSRSNDYVESDTYYTLNSLDQDVTINLTPDINN